MKWGSPMSLPIDSPPLSVITVTYNPRWDLLNWALDSLEKQTLPKSDFEVVIVDNNSNPPLEESRLREGRALRLRLIREPNQGNTFARCAGIMEARSDVLVFLDDDNHFDPDYLEQALRIARAEPELGAFGGMARPVFESPIASWKSKLLPHLGARDYGPAPITSRETHWGEWEPIGAGMVFRRDVGEEFVEWVRADRAAMLLGRKARALMSGEDTLIAQAAYRLGYACSYQPALKMSHCMKKNRLQYRVLAGTIHGHGRSYVILQQLIGNPVPKPRLGQICKELYCRYRYHVKSNGLKAGTVKWCWDVGYFRQARKTN